MTLTCWHVPGFYVQLLTGHVLCVVRNHTKQVRRVHAPSTATPRETSIAYCSCEAHVDGVCDDARSESTSLLFTSVAMTTISYRLRHIAIKNKVTFKHICLISQYKVLGVSLIDSFNSFTVSSLLQLDCYENHQC